MTINKIQVQSSDKIGIFLPQPFFGHVQLYTAMSREITHVALRELIVTSNEKTNLKPKI